MKNILLLISCFVFAFPLMAQTVPQGMKYQAVARDLQGKVQSDENIDLKILLHAQESDGLAGQKFYEEYHNVTTNQFGLFSIVIGDGASKDAFFDIPWSTEEIWMTVSIWNQERQMYAIISSNRLLAVPYAFHAGTADKIKNVDSANTGGHGIIIGGGGGSNNHQTRNQGVEGAWLLKGNANTNPDKEKLGTTDEADLVVVTNDIERMRVTEEGNVHIMNNLNVRNNGFIDRDFQVLGNSILRNRVEMNTEGGMTVNHGKFLVENQSLSHLTGDLIVSGTLIADYKTILRYTLDVLGEANFNNALNVNNMSPTYLSGTLTVDGQTDLNNALNVNGMSPTYLSGTLTVEKQTDLNSALNVNNMSPTYLSGDLTVDGAVDLKSSLSVGENLNVGQDLNVAGNSNLSGPVSMSSTLEVEGQTDLNNDLYVNNASSTNLSGVLNVDGNSNFNSRVTVNAFVSGDQKQQDSYPMLIKGSNQGLAIEVNSATTNPIQSGRGNNYISFWENTNGSVAQQGRIEGMNLGDLDPTGLVSVVSGFISQPPSQLGIGGYSIGTFSLPVPTLNIGTKSVGIGDPINISFDIIDPSKTSVSLGDVDYSNPFNSINGTLSGLTEAPTGGPASTIWNNIIRPALNSNGLFDNNPNFESQIFSNYTLDILNGTISTLGEIVTFATSLASILDPEDIFSEAVGLVVEIVNLIIYGSYADINLGVAYESGSGDYAEWLVRADSSEIINSGDVVGVIGGQISKEFMHADRFMVVSTAPIVLGNMPSDAAGESLSEKVAFMGQVPVKVRGEVKIGDYILPAGEGDGTGIAVAPEKMMARDYQRIIGVAWENSDPYKFINLIHTAVGVNHNDMSKLIEDMQHTMNLMQQAIKEINPDYEMRTYNVDQPSYVQEQPLDYSVAPSHKSHATEYFKGKTYNSRQEMLQDVKRALVEEANINLDQVPLVEYMLDHPEQSEEIAAYYNQLMGDMMWITAQVNEASKKR